MPQVIKKYAHYPQFFSCNLNIFLSCLANVKFLLILFNFKLSAQPKKETKPKSPKKAAKKAGAKKGIYKKE